jgi:hypothetical protein
MFNHLQVYNMLTMYICLPFDFSPFYNSHFFQCFRFYIIKQSYDVHEEDFKSCNPIHEDF